MSEQEKAITLTPSQLEAMLTRVAQELRKPKDLTPEEKAVKDQDIKTRREGAEVQKQISANRRWVQEHGCDHNREDGTCAAVHNQGLGFMLCQRCNAIIYPEGAHGVEYGIYNTALFNQLFRRSNATGVTF